MKVNVGARPTRACLVIELQALYDGGGLLAVVSIPGREGTLSRTWTGRPPVAVTEPQASDIKAWLLSLVDEFMVTAIGVQGELRP